MIEQKLQARILPVGELLSQAHVQIPHYQRPYKWTVKNVNALLDDFFHFKAYPKYRIGTVVHHHEKKEGVHYLVDGQQRTMTLALIALAISQNNDLMDALREHRFPLPKNTALSNFKITHPVSQENIRTNFREIKRRVADFDIEAVKFFFDRCEVVLVTLENISEAFQFFDSQNARGKDLDPHDLLKAFHLREIGSDVPENTVKELAAHWESQKSSTLSHTFSHYLFRIKNWSRRSSARFFTKNDIETFKGISPSVSEPFPYAKLYRITHFYVDGYNDAYHRNIDRANMPFPFQLDQVVINGKRFFEMVQHYVAMIVKLEDQEERVAFLTLLEESDAKNIMKCIDTYPERYRTGDRYVRNLFNTALLYYIDKFGHVDLERAIEKIFIWAYTLRLRRQNVQLASMDNYAKEAPRLFTTIKEALQPADFLNISLPVLDEKEYRAATQKNKLKEILELFKKLNYTA